MGNRREFQQMLTEVLGNRWKVYSQPPESIKLSYPCAIIHLNDANTIYADNRPYRSKLRFQVTLIHKEIDIPEFFKVLEIPMSTFDRQFRTDNLYHDVFEIYY